MILPPSNTRVYLAVGNTDMRKEINGLSVLVESTLELDPFLCGEPRYVSPTAIMQPSAKSDGSCSYGRRHIRSTDSQADLGLHPSVETDGPPCLG